MYKLVVFVPVEASERVKDAMFSAGAGKIGDYDRCAWQTLGRGQFRPLQGSDAYIGEIGQEEYVDEYRIEMVCDDACIQGAVAALRAAHPYEEPAFDVWKLADANSL